MSTWSKIMDMFKENKLLIGSLIGAVAGLILYKVLTQEEKPVQLMDEREKYLHELQELKSRINVEVLGKEDLKEIFDFLLKATRKRLSDHSAAFKSQRRALRNVDFQAYLNCLVGGFTKMQEITVDINNDIMKQLGISEQKFQMATMQHPETMSYMPKLQPLVKFRELTLEQIRESLKFQKVKMENHGQQIIDKIKKISEKWDPSAKQMLPILFGFIMSDQIHEDLGFQEEQVQQARVKYKHELATQIASVQQAVAPFISQVTSAPLFGMAGMGGMGMGGMGPGMEGMDPEAFESFMNMMGGMDPAMFQGMDPSMMGFDPSMMGGMNFDLAMMEQIANYQNSMQAQNQRLGI